MSTHKVLGGPARFNKIQLDLKKIYKKVYPAKELKQSSLASDGQILAVVQKLEQKVFGKVLGGNLNDMVARVDRLKREVYKPTQQLMAMRNPAPAKKEVKKVEEKKVEEKKEGSRALGGPSRFNQIQVDLNAIYKKCFPSKQLNQGNFASEGQVLALVQTLEKEVFGKHLGGNTNNMVARVKRLKRKVYNKTVV